MSEQQQTEQPVEQTVEDSVNTTVEISADQSVDKSVDQPVDQTMDQPVNQPVNQPATQKKKSQSTTKEPQKQSKNNNFDESVDKKIAELEQQIGRIYKDRIVAENQIPPELADLIPTGTQSQIQDFVDSPSFQSALNSYRTLQIKLQENEQKIKEIEERTQKPQRVDTQAIPTAKTDPGKVNITTWEDFKSNFSRLIS